MELASSFGAIEDFCEPMRYCFVFGRRLGECDVSLEVRFLPPRMGYEAVGRRTCVPLNDEACGIGSSMGFMAVKLF